MDIRIGNDIKLNLTLIGAKDFDATNVKQIQCFLINTTLDKCFEDCVGTCSIKKRFPREPFPQFYTPTAHTLHTCGKPGYFVHPAPSKGHYTACGGWFNDYHIWCGYNGFGVKPGKFSADPGYNMPLLPAHKHFSHDCVYRASHKIVSGVNLIEVYFPAYDLRMCGSYKLVVMITTYESGWGKTNLHTYTIDKGDVFTLVDDEHGMSGNISINVDTQTIENHKAVAAQASVDKLYIRSNSTLFVNDTDIDHNKYNIIVTLDDDTLVYYTPFNWEYDKLSFESSNEAVLTVNKNGTLSAGTATSDTEVVITITNPNLGIVLGTFTVEVKLPQGGYIGFSSADSVSTLQTNILKKVNNIFTNHNVVNTTTGNYLWIVSTKPVSDVNIDGSTKFDVPLAPAEKKTISGVEYYCYHCPNALIATEFNITVEEDLS